MVIQNQREGSVCPFFPITNRLSSTPRFVTTRFYIPIQLAKTGFEKFFKVRSSLVLQKLSMSYHLENKNYEDIKIPVKTPGQFCGNLYSSTIIAHGAG